jgi:hypothetical protein
LYFKKNTSQVWAFAKENSENHQGPVLYFLGNLKNRLGPGFGNPKKGSSKEGAVGT